MTCTHKSRQIKIIKFLPTTFTVFSFSMNCKKSWLIYIMLVQHFFNSFTIHKILLIYEITVDTTAIIFFYVLNYFKQREPHWLKSYNNMNIFWPFLNWLIKYHTFREYDDFNFLILCHTFNYFFHGFSICLWLHTN